MSWVHGTSIVVLSIYLIAGAQSADAIELILNGSFETGPEVPTPPGYLTLYEGDASMPGWTVRGFGGGSVDRNSTYYEPSDGQHSIDLAGFSAGGVEQEISTAPGMQYTVLFDMAGNPTVNADFVKTLEVSAAGQSRQFSFDNTGQTHSEMGWTEMSWEFMAVDTSTTLLFRQIFPNNAEGAALDNVRVTPSWAAGDANGDGFVTAADYTLWADNFGLGPGATFAQGDFNLDGFVNGADYTLWADNYTGLLDARISIVPEPEPGLGSLCAGLALLILAAKTRGSP